MTVQAFEVRAVNERGRMRLRTENGKPALYVTCPRGWRENLQRGALLTIKGHIRAQGDCVVMLPITGAAPCRKLEKENTDAPQQ